MASKFTEEDLELISRYLAEKYPAIKGSADQYRYSDIKIDIHERIVRVEEELKHQRDLLQNMFQMSDKRFEQMEKRFEQVDKRFEQVDKRFEQVDKRFEELRLDMDRRFEQVDKRFNMMMWFTGIGFTLITTIITGTFVLMK